MTNIMGANYGSSNDDLFVFETRPNIIRERVLRRRIECVGAVAGAGTYLCVVGAWEASNIRRVHSDGLVLSSHHHMQIMLTR